MLYLTHSPDVLPAICRIRSSDVDTRFSYYGYRYYTPINGRWASRDPIGERGSVYVYGLSANRSINAIDPLGLSAYIDSGPFYRHWLWGNGADYHVTFNKYAPDWDANHFPLYKHGREDICGKNEGDKIPIDEVDQYDTNDAPGQIDVRLKGEFTKFKRANGSCGWTFKGEITIDKNLYDFDHKPYGQRDGEDSWLYYKENATRFGGLWSGPDSSDNDYWIIFDGSKKADTNGDCQ